MVVTSHSRRFEIVPVIMPMIYSNFVFVSYTDPGAFRVFHQTHLRAPHSHNILQDIHRRASLNSGNEGERKYRPWLQPRIGIEQRLTLSNPTWHTVYATTACLHEIFYSPFYFTPPKMAPKDMCSVFGGRKLESPWYNAGWRHLPFRYNSRLR